MDTAQESRVNSPKRPQGAGPGKPMTTPAARNTPARRASSAASTSAPQPSFAAYSPPGEAMVSSSFQVLPLCSSSQLRLARVATLRGITMASTIARL